MSATVDDQSIRATIHNGTIPGESGLWVFLFGDMAMFIVIFAAYLLDRAQDPALFDASRQMVGITIGMVNTIILLTSSLLVAIAVNAVRANANQLARRFLVGALLCALTFMVLKSVEYGHLISAGHGPDSNLYFTYFFMLTGLHLSHVLIGLVTLGIMISRTRQEATVPKARRVASVEAGGCYWHLVDLLWMVIFPLLYLLG